MFGTTIYLDGMSADGIYNVLKAIEDNSEVSANNFAIDGICDYLGANATRLLAKALNEGDASSAEILHDLFDEETPGWSDATVAVFNWKEARRNSTAPHYHWALEAAAEEAKGTVRGGIEAARAFARFEGMATIASLAIDPIENEDSEDSAEMIIKAFFEVYGLEYAEM